MGEGVLFVSNGNGERAIAERIARELRGLVRPSLALDHLALVGVPSANGTLATVGPSRTMPSGGLVAMGNVRAFACDLRAGFVTLLLQQLTFLRGPGSRYRCVVAVGDVYALLLARLTRRHRRSAGEHDCRSARRRARTAGRVRGRRLDRRLTGKP